ncbi:MAG: hypothetical protein MUO76_09905, partial [Anaerolineaceae bacterium]|nr:hypothetical protein [Anaerolineaceae bacterium]
SSEQSRDRVEVILIITGLGATPIETKDLKTINEIAAFEKETRAKQVEAVHSEKLPAVEFAGSSKDLDIPAFIRRRMR